MVAPYAQPVVLVDPLEELLALFDLEVRELIERESQGLEQIAFVAERPLQLKLNGMYYDYDHLTPTLEAVAYAVQRLGGFRPDGRTGIRGRLHRLSEIRSAHATSIGMVIRIGRSALGMAEPLRPLLQTRGLKLLIVGGPGSRKTTLLRDCLRISGEHLGWGCVVVDTSGEVAGDSLKPHPSVGRVGIIPVHDVHQQDKLITQVMANLGPERIAVDELKYRSDVEVMDNIARSGVDLISTVHARNLCEFVRKPIYHSLCGYIDLGQNRRLTDPAFNVIVEARGGGEFRLHTEVASALDQALAGQEPQGLQV